MSGGLSHFRCAVLTDLSKRADSALGRTALMKLAYFLQAVRGVSLGYNFKLYTYGPYDSQVLEDIKVAEGFGALDSEYFQWRGGSGYRITPGPQADSVLELAVIQLREIEPDLEWVASQFGSKSATDLEIASTVIYVDRARGGTALTEDEITSRVHSIKPHHSPDKIRAEVRNLQSRQLIELNS